jgi:Protein of unknown function (DUF3631)
MGDNLAPWGGIIDGAELLNRVEKFLSRFVAYPSEAARIAHTLWIAHCWFMDSWESTPRIAFLSPEPGSGKSRALEVTEPLVPRPIHQVNASPAYLFRKVSDEAGPPTILYDEIDTVFGPKAKDNEDVRGMLNAGHRRGAVAGRCVTKGKTVVTEELPAYCAVALAGLNDLPDTIRTRSVIIRMRRRAPGEKVEPWRHRINAPEADPIAKDLARWAETSTDLLGWPNMPVGIEDRNADVWEALLAIADLAAGGWSDRARRAAVALVAAAADQRQSLGIQLLADLRTVFSDSDVMATETILEKLHALEESPWNDLRGKQLDARGLASKLKKYDVPSPTSVRVGDKTPRGYKREWLVDIWTRYLPPSPAKGATSATPQHSSAAGSESVADSGLSVADVPPHVADSQPSNHAHVADVADVADKSEDGGEEPLWDSEAACVTDSANGHRTHCRDCGTELRPPLEARGTCGPCHFKAGNAA